MSNTTVDTLKSLLERVVDSRDGYKECAEKATQDRHKKMFTTLAEERTQFTTDIKQAAGRYGKTIDTEDGSFMADVHRFFTGLSQKLDSENDEPLLEAIVSGEEKLVNMYEDAIAHIKEDDALVNILQTQLRSVKSNLSLMEAKEEAA